MKLHRIGKINKDQKGFTLIELLIGFALVGLLGAGVTMAIFQTFTVNASSTSHMTALKEVESAVHWIIRDTQMAQVKLASGEEGVSGALQTNNLILRWSNPFENGQLKRTHSHTDKDGNTSTSETVVARHIDVVNTSSELSDGVLTFNITASIDGLRPESESRSFQVVLRSTPKT
jgi:prepilin-type N-terminal cleavage/methylation domain-containing protein